MNSSNYTYSNKACLSYYWIACLVCFLWYGSGNAQSPSRKYTSSRLENIAAVLEAEYQIDCSHAQVHPFRMNTLVITANSLQEINHIGFKLFSNDLIQQNPSPVYHFVERYLLELFMMKNNVEIATKLKEDKVTLQSLNNKNLVDILPLIKADTPLIITTDNNYYTVTWREQNRSLLLIRFPIQYELLWGINKIEAENRFYPELLIYQSRAATPAAEQTASPAGNLTALNDSCYVYTGETYGIDEMNSNQYYKRQSDGKYVPLCDPSYPEESIRNLFTNEQQKAISTSVTQCLYHNRKLEFDITLSQFKAFCNITGCKAYTGIESIEGNLITGTVIMQNRSAGYNHLIYFSTDLRILAYPQRYKINMRLYAYVPTHNVFNLFSKQETIINKNIK